MQHPGFLPLKILTNIQAQHRGDDLESLGYMLIDFLRPSLPWVYETTIAHELKEMICEKTMSVEDLCNGLPWEFAAYFEHIRLLSPDDTPDYSYLRQIFLDLFVRESFDADDVYDWTILSQQLKRESSIFTNDNNTEMGTATPTDTTGTDRGTTS